MRKMSLSNNASLVCNSGWDFELEDIMWQYTIPEEVDSGSGEIVSIVSPRNRSTSA